MKSLVIDSNIAVKWVFDEPGTPEALLLLTKWKLVAPDLLMAECANAIWKKVQRKEIVPDEALIAARLLEGAEVELRPSRPLLAAAVKMAIALDHPAYDCLYLALATANGWPFATADERFLRKLNSVGVDRFEAEALSLPEAASA